MILVTLVSFGSVGCGVEDDSRSAGPRSMIQTATVESLQQSGELEGPAIGEIVLQPQRPTPGRTVQVKLRRPGGKPSDVAYSYRWQTPSGRVLGDGQSFDTAGLRGGTRIEVVVSASRDGSIVEEKVQAFKLAQAAPAIDLVVIDSSEGTKVGSVLEAVAEVANAESSRVDVKFEWMVNGTSSGDEDTLDTAALSPGDVVVLRARLREGARPISSPPVKLTRGDAPTISSKPLAGIEGGLFQYQIRARSPEPQAVLSYALLSGPEGMTVDKESGLVRWKPTREQRGRFEVEVSASDQWGGGVAQSFVIVADAPAGAPASPR